MLVINLLVSIDVSTLAPPWLRQLALRTVPVSIIFVQDNPKEPLYMHVSNVFYTD